VEFDRGCTHWMGHAQELRPEIRFDHAFDAEPHDNPTDTPEGGEKNQLMLAADMILRFEAPQADALGPIVAGFRLC
jgi:hypothetical protein